MLVSNFIINVFESTYQTIHKGTGSPEVQDTEQDACGVDQGNAVRTGSVEAERQEVTSRPG
jgi:hypothetical protein